MVLVSGPFAPMGSPLPCAALPWQPGYAPSEPCKLSEACEVAQEWPGAENFGKVAVLLDQNRLLIKEIHQNHCARQTEGLSRNVELIQQLHNNVAKVVELYQEISASFVMAFASPQEDGSNPL